MIRSVDEEILQDICRDIALENYGFLYVNDHKDEIQHQYEASDKSLMNASSLSASELKSGLQDISERDTSSLRRQRNGVYYVDPFEAREGSRVSDELKSIFTYDLVINKQTIESRFDIAPTDVDFFAGELEREDYIRHINAGERQYYVSGPRLKDETSGDASVDSRLREEAQNGTISHTDLENVIDVAATDDVIRFLEKNDFIIDLNGEYLVKSAIGEYASFIANEICADVLEEFGDVGVLPLNEFTQVLRNEISERYDVLVHLSGTDEEKLLEAVREAVAESESLEIRKRLVVDPERFHEYKDRRAKRVRNEIEEEYDLPSPSDYHDHGHPEIEDIEVTDVPHVNEYVREQIREKFDELADERFAVPDES